MRHDSANSPASAAVSLDPQIADKDWVSFPGGELEAPRPKTLCRACREALQREASAGSHPAPGTRTQHSAPRTPHLLCFQCYRAELDRERALAAAGQLDTASAARFQTQLPFEPVNTARLQALKAERAEARVEARRGIGLYVDKRRQAQIAARHALQSIAAGLKARPISVDAIHAAEMQLPDAWLPFVVSR
jgi:hypothetical protein